MSSAPSADALLARYRARRTFQPPAAWADEIIFPAYDGFSLANVPHTVAAALGAPLPRSAPLDAALWVDAQPQVQRVVLILLDGLGYLYLRQLMAEDAELAAIVAELSPVDGLRPLTSVAPSTTAVALTSLWTGGAPGAHGMLGTSLFLREYSQICTVLFMRPTIGRYSMDALLQWGFKPDEFVPMPGLAQHLASHDLPTYQVQDRALHGTGLSRILHRGVGHPVGHISASDWPLRLRETLRQTRGQRAYISAYWPYIDTLGHYYGSHSHYTAAEIRAQLGMLRDLLRDPELHDGQTLLLITSDHGHEDALHSIDLAQHAHAAPIRAAQSFGATGDNRLALLHLRPGTLDSVTACLDEHFSEQITYISTDEAIASGFYGPQPHASGTRARLGDLILIPRAGWIIDDTSVGKLDLIGWHGGLSEWEMFTPLLTRLL